MEPTVWRTSTYPLWEFGILRVAASSRAQYTSEFAFLWGVPGSVCTLLYIVSGLV